MSSYKQLRVGSHISIWTMAGIWEVRVSTSVPPTTLQQQSLGARSKLKGPYSLFGLITG